MSILTDFIKLPELLCPAGDLSRLKAAVDYGADAVYLAGEEFGMRTAATNFGEEDLKAGIEYADNLTADEFEIKENVSVFPPIKKSNIYEPEPSEEESDFKINSDVFNKIKAERNAARIDLNNDNGTSETKAVPTVKNSNYVSVIKDVSENHASTGVGLKKIHSETERNSVRRTRHYIPNQNEEDNEPQKNERHRPDSNRYSANRRF